MDLVPRDRLLAAPARVLRDRVLQLVLGSRPHQTDQAQHPGQGPRGERAAAEAEHVDAVARLPRAHEPEVGVAEVLSQPRCPR